MRLGRAKVERAWLVRIGDHCQVRCLQYFLPREPKLSPVKQYSRGPGMIYNRWMAQPEMLPFDGTDGTPVTTVTKLPPGLVCPLCKAALSTHRRFLKCSKCRREYPLLHGIPNMLIAEALPKAQETA